MQEHNERAKSIATQVRSFYDCGEKYRIYHGSTNTTRKVKLSRNSIIDTSGMNHVLCIDKDQHIAIVEPNVSMEQLVDATLSHGLVPPVIMEFPAITVGGGFAGSSGESSSFRHGFFDRTINRIEVVLANGDIVEASSSVCPDLFHAAAGSFGTFGVVTMLEVQLVPATKYVELTYSRVNGMEHAIKTIEEWTAIPQTDYLDGILFGLDKGLIISGRLTDDAEPGLQCVQYTRAQDPWFYLRAEEIFRTLPDHYRELVPIKDYLFRYDRGCFWTGSFAFEYFKTPFNALTRWLLDGFMRTRVMYHALHKSRMSDQFIVQDIAFPYSNVGRFVEYIQRKFHFPYLWLCPLKIEENMSLMPRNMPCFDPDARSPGMMLNVGLWGHGPPQYDEFIKANREIEDKTRELGGLKWFYAQAFYTPDQFWKLYSKKWYDDTRSKYHASRLPSVYEKVNVNLVDRKPTSEQNWHEWVYEKFKEQWPVRGVYGVLHTLISREYLLGR